MHFAIEALTAAKLESGLATKGDFPLRRLEEDEAKHGLASPKDLSAADTWLPLVPERFNHSLAGLNPQTCRIRLQISLMFLG